MDTTATAVVLSDVTADAYDYWVKPYNDDLAATAAEATARAGAIVRSRNKEHVSHQPSILIPARLHNLIRAGMSIDIRSAAAMGGQYLGTTQTRRIAAIEWSHAGWTDEPYLWANLQLDRTPRKLPLSQGTKPGPKPPTPGTAPSIADKGGGFTYSNGGFALKDDLVVAGADDDMLIVFVVARYGQPTTGVRWIPDRASVGTYDAFTLIDTATVGSPAVEVTAWKLRGPSPSVASRIHVTQGGLNSATSGAWYYVKGVSSNTVLEAEDTTAGAGVSATVAGVGSGHILLDGVGWQATHSAALTATPGADQTQDYQNGQGGAFGDADAVLATSHQAGSAGGVMSWSTIPSSGDYTGAAHIAIGIVGQAGDTPPPASDDSTGDIGDPTTGCYATCDHKHPAQTAAVTPITDAGGYYTGTDVEAMGQEIGASIAALEAGGSGGSLTPDGSPTAIVNDSSYNAFPGVAWLDAAHAVGSRALLVWRKGTDHASTNDGLIRGMILTCTDIDPWTFSAGTAFTIYDHGSLDVRCEDAVWVDADGSIFVSGRLYDIATSHNQSPFVLKCDDVAADFTSSSTWTKHDIALSSGSAQNYTQGHVLKLADGTYGHAVGWQSAGTHPVGIAIVDDPTDWSSPTIVTIGLGANDYAEIDILREPDNSLTAHLRAATDSTHKRATSSDNGATWSSVSNLFSGLGWPFTLRMASGIRLTVYRSNDGSQDAAWRQDTTGADTTYGSETILDSTGTAMEYASGIQLDGTHALVVYGVQNSSTDADIRSTVFTDSSTDVTYHDELAGVTPDQHHAQRHAIDGADHTTTETDTTKRLAPDGAGGVQWAAGGGGGSITVEEIDGTPSVASVTTIKVTNGKLTDDTGGVVTLDLSGGAGSPTFCGAKAYNSGTQSLAASTSDIPLTLGSEEYDTDGIHSTASNTSRMTIPSGKDGKWLLQGGTLFQGGGQTYKLAVKKNGSTDLRGAVTIPSGTNRGQVQLVVSAVAGDYFELMATTPTGTITAGHASTTDAQTWFAATFLGA
jgi:hypothetical protein